MVHLNIRFNRHNLTTINNQQANGRILHAEQEVLKKKGLNKS